MTAEDPRPTTKARRPATEAEAKALASVMGLKSDVKNETFDSIIPGLSAKRYDLGMSSFTDTKAREKVVNFVTYFSAGTSFYTKAQGGPTVNSLADLCGLKVAVEKGTTQQADATAQSKKCTAAGKKPVSVSVFPDCTICGPDRSTPANQLSWAWRALGRHPISVTARPPTTRRPFCTT